MVLFEASEMDDQQIQAVEQQYKLEHQLKLGANWFYWIAGLSVVNSVLMFSGSSWGFVIGLGITQIIGAIGTAAAEELGPVATLVAFVFTLIATGVFVLFGVFANKRYIWAFIVGMVIYAMDGLLFLLIQDWLSIGFHVFALFCIYRGLKAYFELRKLDNAETAASEQTPLTEPAAE
jgi:hypothetical protein